MVTLNTVEVKGKSREDLLAALSTLGECDADFCGDNGAEYLWDVIDDAQYDSNLEYLLDEVKDIESDEELITQFFRTWLDHDCYYEDYSTNVIYDNDGKAKYIAMAFCTD